MTLDEFFEKLPRDGWRLSLSMLRRSRGTGTTAFASCCPITAAHEAQYAASEWQAAAAMMGLDPGVARRIVRTADGYRNSEDYDRPLRARLLAHCGLAELEARRK